MNRLWIADLHLGGASINSYTGSKFKSKEHREKAIITNANQRVKDGDVVMCVGDFVSYGREQGHEGDRIKAREWEAQLNGKWIFLSGNHDENNSLKYGIDSMVVRLNKRYLAFVTHKPPDLRNVPSACNLIICGHVHQHWHTKFIGNVLAINVGVDVNNYRPISDAEVAEIADRAYGLIKPKKVVEVIDVTCPKDGSVYKNFPGNGCPKCKELALQKRREEREQREQRWYAGKTDTV